MKAPFRVSDAWERAWWRLAQVQGRFRAPLGDRLATATFLGLPLLKEGWQVAAQAAFREPALRARCEHVGEGLRLRGALPAVMGNGPVSIGARAELTTPGFWVLGMGVEGQGRLTIGDDVHIGPGHVFCVARSLTIGNHCRLGPDVAIYDTDLHPRDAVLRRQNFGNVEATECAPVVLEDDVWLGIRVTVLKGVRIGAGAIVGAGAVVTEDVPPYAIAAGNPARVVGDARTP